MEKQAKTPRMPDASASMATPDRPKRRAVPAITPVCNQPASSGHRNSREAGSLALLRFGATAEWRRSRCLLPALRQALKLERKTRRSKPRSCASFSSVGTRERQLRDQAAICDAAGIRTRRWRLTDQPAYFRSAGRMPEIALRRRVGRHHLQHLSAQHVVEGLLGAQDRQRAIEAARIDFAIYSDWVHGGGPGTKRWRPKNNRRAPGDDCRNCSLAAAPVRQS